MAVVSRTSIQELIKKGDIVIYPYNPEKVGNCSVDIRLGEWFFRENKDTLVVYPYDQGLDINKKFVPTHPWNPIPQKAQPAKEFGFHGDTPIIAIKPGEIILATSEEFIGSRVECTTMAKTKSTLARMCVDCFGSAGWGDIGYINRWAFPLHNKSHHTILLRPGTWVAQIVFLKVTDKELSYTQGGTYQSTDDFETLVKTWDPRTQLPKVLSASSNPEKISYFT